MIPHQYRWVLLLVASYYFYMSWNPLYAILILATTVVSYGATRLLEKGTSRSGKKLILAGASIICLGILFFFKYFNFFSESVASMLNVFSLQLNPVTLKLVLPVGISFYTFQTLSYVIDVYKGDIEPEHHFGYYATFISFFPQLVAGPIERACNLLPQIKERHTFNYEQATYGLKLMTWGYFKKLVLADTLSSYASKIYNSPQDFQGFALIVASVSFSFQIYCDFSGYSDIAIGTAKLLGINLSTNFKSPYFSQSVKEFWSRWHISLSTWFRDYIYIPLGGSRVGKIRHYMNLMITFLASGLWHGANWSFVVWGGIHGIAQIIEDVLIPKQYRESKGLCRWIRIGITFVFCTFAWIFFVSNSLSDACYVISHMFCGLLNPINYLRRGFADIGMGRGSLALEICMLMMLAIYDSLSLKVDVINKLSEKKLVIRWGVYLCVGIILIFFSQKGVAAEFVYFQF